VSWPVEERKKGYETGKLTLARRRTNPIILPGELGNESSKVFKNSEKEE